MNTATGFDLDALRRGLEERDADTLVALYAEDAEIVEIDKDHPPTSPRTIRGRDAIATHLADVCGRDMTHTLERPVVGDGRLAFTEACAYSDGTAVMCMATADLDADGTISHQVAVTAWDS